MKNKILLLIVLNYTINVSAQINVKSPNLDASSVFKFTETPVSLNNGLVNINLPIYTIKTKDLAIPIQLDYHSRGIRVEDIASTVGLGWSLSYGGMISRQVRDRPDDSSNGYLITDSYTNFFSDLQKRFAVYNQTIASPTRDLVPDQFYFSTPGYSGKFIFDQLDKKIVQQPFSDYKISPTATQNSLLNSWVIVDDKGNKFHYGTLGPKSFKSSLQIQSYIQTGTPLNSYDLNGDNSEDAYTDTWYLIQIETVSGDLIKYNYTLDESYYYKKDYDKIVYPCISTPCDQPTNPGVYTYFSKIIENKYILESIEFSEGKVKFLPSSVNRTDIQGGKALDKIQIFDSKDHLIEYFKFNYNIQESLQNPNMNSLLALLDTSSNKRMFLSEAIRYSKENTVIEKYNYNYTTTLLPNRFSTSQDMWGYYNNAANGSYLHFFDYNGHLSSNRESNEEGSKAGILESINHSTGLKTEFTYENNLLKPTFNMEGTLGTINAPYQTKSEILLKAGDILPNYNTATNSYYKDIIIDPNLYDSEVKITLDYHAFVNPNMPTQCSYYTGWVEQNGTRVILFPNIGANKTIVKGTSTTRALTGGSSYKLGITAYGCSLDDIISNESESVSLILDYKVANNSTNNETFYYGPGNRIRQIRYLDNNQLKIKKTFEYKGPTGKGSGDLFGMKEYVGIVGLNANNVRILDPKGVFAGSINSSLESNSMGYSYVKEYQGDELENKGRTDYEFTNFADGNNFLKYPFTLPTDNQWSRGLLISKKYFENINNSYRLLQEELNEYKFGGFDTPYEISPPMGFESADGAITGYTKNRNYYVVPLAQMYMNLSHLVNKPLPHNNFLVADYGDNFKIYYKPYYFNSGKIEKNKTTNYEYRNNQVLTFKDTFSYDSNDHYQLTAQKNVFPDLGTQETVYQYAHEKNNTKLINANMVGIPLGTVVKKKQNESDTGKIISRSETKYDSPSNLFPSSVLSYDLQTGTIPSTEITYDKYDSNGNLQQYTTKNGISTTIIWGYNNTQPIAKIEGAKLSDIPQTLIDNIVNASVNDAQQGTDASEQSLISALDLFRNNTGLSTYQISTYTYDPLIGVKSITPPSGIREVYIYDTANRLMEVRENSTTGKILKEFKYNYKQ
ncbi:hypothetical protein JET18_20510 [Chryseobacterium sp. L7]|uniref:YD repeat-containing protein n=1 Tax=Chryseobacterium endalhagicum TaxID=2797638 RepID=A0ABS1QKT5_9FLAO|nr:hypothetical protein [Chryseobacterium endalhagicum]MBL1223237.1 hypothetical protein [Chryseobacterium endalhagicum]